MSNVSFDIKDSTDLYNMLLQDYDEFKRNKISSRFAIHCAIISWHLADWIYKEYEKNNFNTLTDYQKTIKSNCPSLKIMQDITNGSKHLFFKTEYKPEVIRTNLHKGAFQSNAFQNNAFDTDMLEIEMKDGTKLKFEDEIDKVVKFWKKYLKIP